MPKSIVAPERVTPEALLTSYQVGNLLQVNPSSISNWIKQGRLKAYRTPGGHRRIRARDLVAFLHDQRIPVPVALMGATPPRLLWVERDARRREALAAELGRHTDIEARVVEHVVDALVLVAELRPNVLVLESRSEGVDGVQVCEQLKRLPEATQVKVVLEATSPLPEVLELAEAAGAALCSTKPVPTDRVLELLLRG